MKNIKRLSALILIVSAISACSVKTTNSNPTTTSTTSPIGTGNNNNGSGNNNGGGTTTTGGISCDGVNNNGASICYYKNIPTIQVMGATQAAINAGTPYWSSLTNLQGISPAQFSTDTVFNVRIIPRMAVKSSAAVNPSVPGKSCNNTMTKIATKLWIQLKLQTQAEASGSNVGEVATLSASIDQPSTVWHFSKRPSNSPLVLKVVNVLTDSRCQQGGTGYCPYADLPLSTPTNTYPTECVAFDIQFSTDETWDLPGASAN